MRFHSVRRAARGGLPALDHALFGLLSAYSLIQWVLEGKTRGHGYGFPFDRPQVEFAQRLLVLEEQLERIKYVHLRGQWRDNFPCSNSLANSRRSLVIPKSLAKSLR